MLLSDGRPDERLALAVALTELGRGAQQPPIVAANPRKGATGMQPSLEVRSGPWDRSTIEDFLRESVIPVRVATSGGGGPLVQSLWFLYEGSALWCCTRDDAVITRRLLRDPRCGFEVCADAPPYRGIRGQGSAEVVPERAADLLPRLIERYLGSTESDLAQWLLSRLDREVAIRISDLSVTSFDFSRRMGG